MGPVAVAVLSSLARGERKKKEEGDIRGTREGGTREGGTRAGVGETKRQVRRRERESACRSEALYPPVERDLGAQCYDGHQADRSQPLQASSGPHVVPPVRPD